MIMADYVRKADHKANVVDLWVRVSTAQQDTDPQLLELRQWVTDQGLVIGREFVFADSAWQSGNGKGSLFDRKREELLERIRLGHSAGVATWAVDRLSRRGAEDLLRFVRVLTEEYGARLLSLRDPWVQNLNDPMAREIILSVFATVAKFESQRRSDRIKGKIAQIQAAGGTWGGRKKGSRNKSGTISDEAKANLRAAWTPERRAALAARNQARAGNG
jgi:DNA invertase Pin-like site-specific DNA recombinase